MGWVEINAVSSSRLHVLMGSTVSLKLYKNFCSFNQLKFNLRQVNNLIPLVSCISKTEFLLDLVKVRKFTLNLLIDPMFLILFLSLFRPVIQYGKREFSSNLVTAWVGFILFRVVDQVGRYSPLAAFRQVWR